jgi:hypothetical protein
MIVTNGRPASPIQESRYKKKTDDSLQFVTFWLITFASTDSDGYDYEDIPLHRPKNNHPRHSFLAIPFRLTEVNGTPLL